MVVLDREKSTADRLIRGTTKLVVCGVAIIAAIVSYRHAYAVVTDYGEAGITAIMIPLTIDGLVYAASMVILHSARLGVKAPLLAWSLLWLGIAATLAANVAHGWRHGIVGSIVAAWPAVALVGCYEMLMWLVRTNSRLSQGRAEVSQVQDGSQAVQAELPVEELAVQDYLESVRSGRQLSERKMAERYGRSRRWARKVISQARDMLKEDD